MADDDLEAGIGDPVVREAVKRWKRCSSWESGPRGQILTDVRFHYADSVNNDQWPQTVLSKRRASPCLTLNITRQHNLQIINAGKQNRSEVKIVGAGQGASARSAEIFQAVVRRIQYSSAAQTCYDVAREWQVIAGIGYWRLATRYVEQGERAGPEAFDQEIEILPVIDPTKVYLDPDIRQRDGSDARFGFYFDDVLKDEFEEFYPDWADEAQGVVDFGGFGNEHALDKDYIRVVEYFRKVRKKDQLFSFVDPTDGARKNIRASLLEPALRSAVRRDKMTKVRTVYDDEVEWKLIVGDKIVDETIWPGKYIPLVRVVGEEVTIEGKLDRKGHTRAMMDAQRMYNYNASAQVEFGALQTKVPWTGAQAAIEPFANKWATANIENHSFLPFKHDDEAGNPLPAQALPHRNDPPAISPAYQAGMETAFNQMMMVSGQWQNQMGMQGNERTGSAIQKRQDQGDTATFHFTDNYEKGLIYTGKQIIDLIPKLYDTQRMIMIDTPDGPELLSVDPAAEQAFQELTDEDGKVLARVFNPGIGKYELEASSGTAVGTQREATVEAMTLLLTQSPGLTGLLGDVLLKSMDFPGAQEAAQRLFRMVPQQALGKGPSPEEQKLAAQVQSLQVALEKALQQGGQQQLKIAGKDQMRDIDAYEAETKRLEALASTMPVPDALAQGIVKQLGTDMGATNLEPDVEQDSGGGKPPEQGSVPPPVPGAKQASDGNFYMLDPTREGKYLRIAPLVQQRTPVSETPR